MLHRENSRASATRHWDIAWIANDEFKLSNAYIGDVSWKRQPDGDKEVIPLSSPCMWIPDSR